MTMSHESNPVKSKPSRLAELEHSTAEFIGVTSRQIRKETRRWPALLALVAILAAFILISDRLAVLPGWLWGIILAVLVVPAIIARLQDRHQLNHNLLLAVGVLIVAGEMGSIILLLLSLGDKSVAAVSLLRDAAILWVTNVVAFALIYWLLDAGGAYRRSHEACEDYRQNADLLFPQLTLIEQRPQFAEWRPGFSDYLFVAFNTSTAFSPTDTPILGTQLKVASMVQATLSLVTLAAIAARAINIL